MGRGRVTFLCVCPGLPVLLRHIVSCVSPLLRVCTYACACVSAGKEDSFISSCLDYSHLKDVCVGKQRAATAHTHTSSSSHTHVASSTVLNLQAHTHTWECQCRSQGTETGWPERSTVYLWNTILARAPK